MAGDIIYLEPSETDYGSVDIRKRLTIIGTGYYSDKNSNMSFETRTSKITGATFNNGSANSVLTGVVFSDIMYINDVNVTVTRCQIGNIVFGASSNLIGGVSSRGNNGTISKCLVGRASFGGILGTNSTVVNNQYGYNCTITNNIGVLKVNALTNSVINNNTFWTYWSGSSAANLRGCTVSNNIFDARGLTSTILFVEGISSGNTISNNICLGQAATPSGSGNISSANGDITFLVLNPWATIGTEDSKFQLATGSPAAGIGTGGTNAGAFGGASPYVLSGMPAYPVITNYTVSGAGNTSVPLNVSVTVRGNN